MSLSFLARVVFLACQVQSHRNSQVTNFCPFVVASGSSRVVPSHCSISPSGAWSAFASNIGVSAVAAWALRLMRWLRVASGKAIMKIRSFNGKILDLTSVFVWSGRREPVDSHGYRSDCDRWQRTLVQTPLSGKWSFPNCYWILWEPVFVSWCHVPTLATR